MKHKTNKNKSSFSCFLCDPRKPSYWHKDSLEFILTLSLCDTHKKSIQLSINELKSSDGLIREPGEEG